MPHVFIIARGKIWQMKLTIINSIIIFMVFAVMGCGEPQIN